MFACCPNKRTSKQLVLFPNDIVLLFRKPTQKIEAVTRQDSTSLNVPFPSSENKTTNGKLLLYGRCAQQQLPQQPPQQQQQQQQQQNLLRKQDCKATIKREGSGDNNNNKQQLACTVQQTDPPLPFPKL
jgi:hypothetical protein